MVARFVLPWEPDSAVPCRQRLGEWGRPTSHGHHYSVHVLGAHPAGLCRARNHRELLCLECSALWGDTLMAWVWGWRLHPGEGLQSDQVAAQPTYALLHGGHRAGRWAGCRCQGSGQGSSASPGPHGSVPCSVCPCSALRYLVMQLWGTPYPATSSPGTLLVLTMAVGHTALPITAALSRASVAAPTPSVCHAQTLRDHRNRCV